jgi:hypothetical protein
MNFIVYNVYILCPTSDYDTFFEFTMILGLIGVFIPELYLDLNINA